MNFLPPGVAGFCLVGLLLTACSSDQSSRKPQPYGQSGEQLARTWCGGCHAFPDLSLLDKKSWRTGVLPEMTSRLGLSSTSYNPYTRLAPEDLDVILRTNVYPGSPLLAEEDFQKTAAFYERLAPDSLPA